MRTAEETADKKEGDKMNDEKNTFYLYLSKSYAKDFEAGNGDMIIVGRVNWINNNIIGARRDVCTIMSQWERFKEIAITTETNKEREAFLLNKAVYESIKSQKNDNRLIISPEETGALDYGYLHGWYDGAREVMKMLGKGDK